MAVANKWLNKNTDVRDIKHHYAKTHLTSPPAQADFSFTLF